MGGERLSLPLLLAAGIACAFGGGTADDPASATCNDPEYLPLSQHAHTSNMDFIDAAERGSLRAFRPQVRHSVMDAAGRLHAVDFQSERFFTYDSDNGWNNQMINLLCAIDMAKLLNRTLVLPPFQWPRRRGAGVKVSVARLVDLASIASLGVRVLAEDEFGSVAAAIDAAAAAPASSAVPPVAVVPGEGQPHRKQRMPRWSRARWSTERAGEPARLLRVTCCLFWLWQLPEPVSRELYRVVQYHPALVAAARAAAAPLGQAFGAMHIRRGDKAKVDRAYTAVWAKMDAAYFVRLAEAERMPRGAVVYVATDELDHGWFEALTAAGYALRFVDDLSQGPLLSALSAFPQALWVDVLAILEQLICIDAQLGFVPSLPSTLSGHIVNVRAARATFDAVEHRPLFVKLHESCCDARTALDLLRLDGVSTLHDVPCEPHAGNPWC